MMEPQPIGAHLPPTHKALAMFVDQCHSWSQRTRHDFMSVIGQFEHFSDLIETFEPQHRSLDAAKHARRSLVYAETCGQEITRSLLPSMPSDRVGRELHPMTAVLLHRGTTLSAELHGGTNGSRVSATTAIASATRQIKLEPFVEVEGLRLSELAPRGDHRRIGLGPAITQQLRYLRVALEKHRAIRPAADAFFSEVAGEFVQAPVTRAASIEAFERFWALCMTALRYSDAARHAPRDLCRRRDHELERIAAENQEATERACQAAQAHARELLASEAAQGAIARILVERKSAHRLRLAGPNGTRSAVFDSSESDEGEAARLSRELERVPDARVFWAEFSALTSRPDSSMPAYVALYDRTRAEHSLEGLKQLIADDVRRIAAAEFCETFERVWRRDEAARVDLGSSSQPASEAALQPTHLLTTFHAYFDVELQRTAFMQHLRKLEALLHTGLDLPLDARRTNFFFDTSVRQLDSHEGVIEVRPDDEPRFYPFPRSCDPPGTACAIGVTPDGARVALEMRVPYDHDGKPDEHGVRTNADESCAVSLEVLARALLYSASDVRKLPRDGVMALAELLVQLPEIERTGDLTLWRGAPSRQLNGDAASQRDTQ